MYKIIIEIIYRQNMAQESAIKKNSKINTKKLYKLPFHVSNPWDIRVSTDYMILLQLCMFSKINDGDLLM